MTTICSRQTIWKANLFPFGEILSPSLRGAGESRVLNR